MSLLVIISLFAPYTLKATSVPEVLPIDHTGLVAFLASMRPPLCNLKLKPVSPVLIVSASTFQPPILALVVVSFPNVLRVLFALSNDICAPSKLKNLFEPFPKYALGLPPL